MNATNAATHAMRYGTNVAGPYHAPWRHDTYTSRDGGRPVIERRMAAGPDDQTAPHGKLNYGYTPEERAAGHGYDARCSCCWLNISHTRAKHDASIPTKATPPGIYGGPLMGNTQGCNAPVSGACLGDCPCKQRGHTAPAFLMLGCALGMALCVLPALLNL